MEGFVAMSRSSRLLQLSYEGAPISSGWNQDFTQRAHPARRNETEFINPSTSRKEFSMVFTGSRIKR
jgi:hypothetical protein